MTSSLIGRKYIALTCAKQDIEAEWFRLYRETLATIRVFNLKVFIHNLKVCMHDFNVYCGPLAEDISKHIWYICFYVLAAFLATTAWSLVYATLP